MGAAIIPGGKAKGTPLDQATDSDIQYWLDRRQQELERDPDGRFAETTRSWIADAKKVLADRAIGAPPAADRAVVPAGRQQSTRLDRRPNVAPPRDEFAGVQGTFSNPLEANDALTRAAAMGHLITPATGLTEMPIGCSLSITIVWVEQADTYPVRSGALGLGKSALYKIANAAGVSWDPAMSCRTDDGRDADFVEWKAVGRYRAFDGTPTTLTAIKRMDLRDNSRVAKGLKPNELQMQRCFIEGHAQTKAEERVIRKFGLRHAYTAEELRRPFFVARMQFTGATTDPVLKRVFAEKIADSYLSASVAAYGPAQAPQQALAPAAPAPQQLAPAPRAQRAPTHAPQYDYPEPEDDDDLPPPHMMTDEPPPEPPPRARTARRAPVEPPPNAGDSWVPDEGQAP